jgi:uncharacterized protein YigE (DUF2233 family)
VSVVTVSYLLSRKSTAPDDRFVSYTVDTKKQDIKFYWKNDTGEIFRSINSLNNWLASKNKNLIFAMNGGMFKADNSPQGLFVENGNEIRALDTATGSGNFYLMPNGVFFITTNNEPIICKTTKYKEFANIKYATQSGPMLVINGQIHSAFKKGSTNLNIRNGVGILPNNTVLFAMSKNEINLYDFANYFKKLGCKNALYLDGFVSRTYLPEQNCLQTDGNFGVIIGVTEHKN